MKTTILLLCNSCLIRSFLRYNHKPWFLQWCDFNIQCHLSIYHIHCWGRIVFKGLPVPLWSTTYYPWNSDRPSSSSLILDLLFSNTVSEFRLHREPSTLFGVAYQYIYRSHTLLGGESSSKIRPRAHVRPNPLWSAIHHICCCLSIYLSITYVVSGESSSNAHQRAHVRPNPLGFATYSSLILNILFSNIESKSGFHWEPNFDHPNSPLILNLLFSNTESNSRLHGEPSTITSCKVTLNFFRSIDLLGENRHRALT